MKKFLVNIFVIVMSILLTSCALNKIDSEVIIREDYSCITYNSKSYKISKYHMEIPEDYIEYDAIVEGKPAYLQWDTITYDVVCASNIQPDYIWLFTTTDKTECAEFNNLIETSAYLTYKLEI